MGNLGVLIKYYIIQGNCSKRPKKYIVMETTTNKEFLEQGGSTLQIKRALLSIDAYAAREGISKGIVEECGKLGIVQIRKCKGKTFVVDVPLSPYSVFTKPEGWKIGESCGPEIQDEEIKCVDDLGDVKDNVAGAQDCPSTPETATAPIQPIDEAYFAEKISQLAQSLVHDASKPADESRIDETNSARNIRPGLLKITVKSALACIVGVIGLISRFFAKFKPVLVFRFICRIVTLAAIKAGQVFQLLKKIFHRIPEVQSRSIEAIADEAVDTKKFPEFPQIPPESSTSRWQDYGFQFGVLSTLARAKRIWQVVAIFSLMFLFISLFAGLWLYMDRRIQFDRLDQYGASFQKMYEDSMQANQRVEILQSELVAARAGIERLKIELDSSRAEVKSVQNELIAARGNLETIQQRNAEAVERLNDQIQRLTNRLPGTMENHQVLPKQ